MEVGLPVERRQEVMLEAVPCPPAVLPLMRVAVLAVSFVNPVRMCLHK